MNRQDAKDAKIGRTEPDGEIDHLAYRVIGCAREVHRHLGPGFLESVYEEALSLELRRQGVPFARQSEISIAYKGDAIGVGRVDFLVDNQLIVELKATDALAHIHTAQVLSYLRMTRCKLGLLINFNVTMLRQGVERVVLSL
ncbi:MAG: GxxExxY protein [Thermomicrobiales bacterium]